MSNPKVYTVADLYGPGSRPQASDVDQDRLFDCYFLAPAAALADRQPDRIKDAISYNPLTSEFAVRLYRPSADNTGGAVETVINVSQDALHYNIENQKGGSAVDNNRERLGAVWPAVLEAAFAEAYRGPQAGLPGLKHGYEIIGDPTRGGGLQDGMFALTGDRGTNVRIGVAPTGPRMVSTGADHIDRGAPPFAVKPVGSVDTFDAAVTKVERAMADGRPVTLSTQGREVRDGLMESHAHIVAGLSRDSTTGDTLLWLRNPYADNLSVNEGNQNIVRGWDSKNPEITVSLDKLVREGSFAEFNIGPAPRRPTQDITLKEPNPLTPSDVALHANVRTSVQQVEGKIGKVWDDNSDRLTASLTYLAKQKGFTERDQLSVMFNVQAEQLSPGALVFLHRTGPTASPDPAANRAHMSTSEALAMPAVDRLQQLANTPDAVQSQARGNVPTQSPEAVQPSDSAVQAPAQIKR